MTDPAPPRFSPFARWLAAFMVLITLAMICVGGVVTSLGAGMAVTDWPGTFGKVMLLAPWDSWVHQQGPFWEHTHRLLGHAVGTTAIALCIVVWFTQKNRPWLRWLAWILMGLVGLQALLGGFRVSDVSTPLAAVHGVFAQLLLGVAVIVAAALGKVWNTQNPVAPVPPKSYKLDCAVLMALPLLAVAASVLVYKTTPKPADQHNEILWKFNTYGPIWFGALGLFFAWAFVRLIQALRALPKRAYAPKSRSTRSHAWMVLALLLVQICLGAGVRHFKAQMAIPDAPLSYGHMMPPMSQPKINAAVEKLDEKTHARVMLDGVTADDGTAHLPAWKVHLHFTHTRLLPLLISLIVIGWLAVLKKHRAVVPVPRLPMLLLPAIILAQILLGVFTIWNGVGPAFATAHQTLGAACFAAAVWLAVHTCVASQEKGLA